MDIQIIQNKIYEIRGQRVMLDFDLAALYQVTTSALNQAVKRNIKRFPDDFMFQLSKGEFDNLKSQIVTSSWGGTRKPPYAFTEQGLAMLSGLLNSDVAIHVNIMIMRGLCSTAEHDCAVSAILGRACRVPQPAPCLLNESQGEP